MQKIFKAFTVVAALLAAIGISRPVPAAADTSSAIISAAGMIVGALLIDSNNHPYYVRDNRRYYVTQDEASYYRSHHRVVQRQAWVPEEEYPVRRNAGYSVPQRQHAMNNDQGHNGQDNGDRYQGDQRH
jgi:hypothetical protein